MAVGVTVIAMGRGALVDADGPGAIGVCGGKNWTVKLLGPPGVAFVKVPGRQPGGLGIWKPMCGSRYQAQPARGATETAAADAAGAHVHISPTGVAVGDGLAVEPAATDTCGALPQPARPSARRAPTDSTPPRKLRRPSSVCPRSVCPTDVLAPICVRWRRAGATLLSSSLRCFSRR